MSNFINLEVQFFLMSVAWGAILLILYDCLRIFRKVIKHGVVLISVEDILYWMVSSVLIFRMMYQLNDGVIRGFSLIGIFLGMVTYKYSISEFIVKGISYVLIQIKRFILKIIHTMEKPVKFLVKQAKKLMQKTIKLLKKRIGNMTHFVQKRLSKGWKALQNKGKRGRMKETDEIEKTKKQNKKPSKRRRNQSKKQQRAKKEHQKDGKQKKEKATA